jgi:hypothetical protein
VQYLIIRALGQSLGAIHDREKEAVAQALEYRQGGYKERKPSGHTETGLATDPTTEQEGREKKERHLATRKTPPRHRSMRSRAEGPLLLCADCEGCLGRKRPFRDCRSEI